MCLNSAQLIAHSQIHCWALLSRDNILDCKEQLTIQFINGFIKLKKIYNGPLLIAKYFNVFRIKRQVKENSENKMKMNMWMYGITKCYNCKCAMASKILQQENYG